MRGIRKSDWGFKPRGIPWNEWGPEFMTGTSVGAIQILGLAHYRNTEHWCGIDNLVKLWDEEIKSTKSIWRWKFPYLLAGLWNQSVGTQVPLEKLLRRVVDQEAVRKSGIKLRMPAVNMRTRRVRVFDESYHDLVEAALASSSFPMAFEPIKIGGDYYTDGGVAEVAPLKPAMQWGAEEVLVILTKDPFDDQGKPKYSNALEFGKAIIDTMSLDVLVNDIIHCHKVNEQVRRGERNDNKRVVDIKVFAPSEKMEGSLDFSPNLMRARIELGEHDFAMLNLLA